MRWRSGIAAVSLIVLGSASGAQAQRAPDQWQVTLAPYLMGAGMNGTTGIGRGESDVDLSASDIFKNLDSAFMGYFEVRKGKWGAGADIIWMALSRTADTPMPITVNADHQLRLLYDMTSSGPFVGIVFRF